MCKISFWILIFSLSVFGSSPKVTTSVSSTTSNGSIDPNNLTLDQGSSSFNTKVQIFSSTIAKYWGVNAGFTNSKADYSNFMIRGKDGSLTPLNFHDSESDGSAGVLFQSGPHTASVGYSQSLSSSPFQATAVNATYSVGIFNKSSIFGTEFSRSQKNQPTSYFIGRNFQNTLRPSQLTSTKLGLFYEQIVSERAKARITLWRSERPEDRPQNFGGELRGGYALSSRIVSKLEVGLVQEDQSQVLKNERGYFDLRWAGASTSFEPLYDFFIVPSYGLTLEKESQPDTQRVVQVATDNYKMDLRYDPGSWSANLNITFQNANTGFQSQIFRGEFSWNL